MKTVLLFPGQGSQYVGMGKEMFERFETARRTFEEASDLLGYSVSRLCFDGDHEELTRTDNAQPCILTVSIAAYRVMLEHLDLEPSYFAGHSLGEISALSASGAIPFSEALQLVRLRGQLMHEAQTQEAGGMLAISGANLSALEEECSLPSFRGHVVVSNLNSKGQTVVSGKKAELEKFREKVLTMGARAVAIPVGAAFHSPLMKPVAEVFENALSRMRFQKMRYSVLSNVTAKPYADSSSIPSLLSEQIVSVVNWQGCMKYLYGRGVERYIETGSGMVLGNLARKDISPGSLIQATDGNKDWNTLLASGGRIDTGIDFAAILKMALCSKNHNKTDSNSIYMSKISGPLRELELFASQTGQVKSTAEEESRSAFMALHKIMEIKQLPEVVRNRMLDDLTEGGGGLDVRYA
ncbi:ACP S-malonyltransferase [Paenibacillus phytohabitans]|nr:ACP S-malonyltransferase [Paenibacillus phytohabitans]